MTRGHETARRVDGLWRSLTDMGPALRLDVKSAVRARVRVRTGWSVASSSLLMGVGKTRCRIIGSVPSISKPNKDAREGALPCARQFDSTARTVRCASGATSTGRAGMARTSSSRPGTCRTGRSLGRRSALRASPLWAWACAPRVAPCTSIAPTSAVSPWRASTFPGLRGLSA